jgi:hypothetical protein
MVRTHILKSAAPFILLLTFISSGLTTAQDTSLGKEPPIPVVLGSKNAEKHFPEEESITLSVSDFNHVMEREDSLRQSFSEQTTTLLASSEKKSEMIYALLFLLVLSNLITMMISRKKSASKTT